MDGFGVSVGVNHGDATLGGSGSYVNIDAIDINVSDVCLRILALAWLMFRVSPRKQRLRSSVVPSAGLLLFLHSIKSGYSYERGVSGRAGTIGEAS